MASGWTRQFWTKLFPPQKQLALTGALATGVVVLAGTKAAAETSKKTKMKDNDDSGRMSTSSKTSTRMMSGSSSTAAVVSSPTDSVAAADTYDTTECPAGRELLGRHTWTFLHTLAAHSVPDKPTESERKELADFMTFLGRYYPCSWCAANLQEHMKKHPPEVDSREAFAQWMCRMHNDVNARLAKPKFDCSRVDERWRDGWKDGHCDD